MQFILLYSPNAGANDRPDNQMSKLNLGKPRGRGISPHFDPIALTGFSLSRFNIPQSMASESPQLEMSPPQSDPRDQSVGASDSNKRKAEQGNGTQARTKRNRYISIAWYDMA